MTIQKSGGLASFLLAVVFVVPELIYLMGNLREANGPLAYALAKNRRDMVELLRQRGAQE